MGKTFDRTGFAITEDEVMDKLNYWMNDWDNNTKKLPYKSEEERLEHRKEHEDFCIKILRRDQEGMTGMISGGYILDDKERWHIK